MNNKRIGTAFENRVCEMLAKDGWWVHFLSPDKRGAQPFDLIAVKDGKAVAADCKTCKDNYFRISRAEDNQILAFEKWMRCGNDEPGFFVEHDSKIYYVGFCELKKYEKIDLRRRMSLVF